MGARDPILGRKDILLGREIISEITSILYCLNVSPSQNFGYFHQAKKEIYTKNKSSSYYLVCVINVVHSNFR